MKIRVELSHDDGTVIAYIETVRVEPDMQWVSLDLADGIAVGNKRLTGLITELYWHDDMNSPLP